jgi:uncharacterized protein
MTSTTQAFLLNVGFVVRESSGYGRVFEFDVPHFKFDDDFELENTVGVITISRSSEGLLTQAAFDALVNAVCVRCLDSFLQPLTVEFTELYAFPSRAQDDTELIVPAEGKIDFAPLLREYMLLAKPINPVCSESCQGICPECGIHLNKGQCNHEKASGDPRLAVLKKFLDKT